MPSPAFWGLITATVVVFVLIIVGGLMFVRLLEVRKMETAMRHAWNSAGLCTEDNCDLKINAKLPAVSQVVPQELDQYAPQLSRKLMDMTTRISIPANLHKAPAEIPVGPQETLVETFTPKKGPHFGGAFLDRTGPYLVLAFRGTVTKDEIMLDIQSDQVEWNDVLVHSGFLSVFSMYEQAIVETVERYPNHTVFLCGHSLGGAVSQLALFMLAKRYPKREFAAYVFGSPRVGNEKFANFFEGQSAIKGLWRESNTGDILQEMPPMVMPNLKKPLGTLWQYAHAGDGRFFTSQWGSWKHNHSLACYIDHVEKVMLNKKLKKKDGEDRVPRRGIEREIF